MPTKKTGYEKRYQGVHAFGGVVVAGHTLPVLLTFTWAQNATQYGTECEVAVCDKDGNVIPGVYTFDLWLSDAASGAGLTATDPFGTVTAKANSGVILSTYTAKKSFRVQTLATGKFTLQIIDDATPVLLYAAGQTPGIGITHVSAKTVAGNYKP